MQVKVGSKAEGMRDMNLDYQPLSTKRTKVAFIRWLAHRDLHRFCPYETRMVLVIICTPTMESVSNLTSGTT